jgi:homocitrate synthase NifV
MIASLLEEAGVSQIEAGVPATDEYECETIRMIIERKKKAKISVWSRLNEADIRQCLELRPDIVHISVPVSYVHIYSKLRKNKSWVLNQVETCLDLLKDCPAEISAGFEDAFRSDISFLITIARALTQRNVFRIRLADTVGNATPQLCRELFSQLAQHLDQRIVFGYHAHNDLGMAIATTIEAMKCRCDYIDTTILGIGERSGNCDFAKLVKAASSVFDFGITPQAALIAQEGFLKVLGDSK